MIHGRFLIDCSDDSYDEIFNVLKKNTNPSLSKLIHFEEGKLRCDLALNLCNENAREPQWFSSDNLYIFISGYIYNRKDIATEYNLSLDLVPARLVYELYSNEGEKFVNRLNGDFIICIYDHFNEKLLLFRDHLGIYPLAYIWIDGILWFSSDQEELCRLFFDTSRFNREPFLDYFRMIDFIQLPNSIVKKLLPGHYLSVENKVLQITKYWFPERISYDYSITTESVLDDVQYLIRKSIERRSNLNIPAGSHISGGLDSGIVSALARSYYRGQKHFYGFSWSPDNYNIGNSVLDERELVKEQCRINDITPVFITLSKSEISKYLSDQKQFSNYYYENKVWEEASKLGVKIIFTGYGGDEFISKGDSGIDLDLLSNLNINEFLLRNPLNKLNSWKKIISNVLFPYLGIISFGLKRIQKIESQYIKRPFKKQFKDNIRKFYFYKSRRQQQLGFLYCYYIPVRIEKLFIRGIKKGIEYRYPLLDKDLVEYSLKIPSELLYKGKFSRIVIREISSGILPENIRWRTDNIDHVSQLHLNSIALECVKSFIGEIDSFKENKFLDFIDFNKINQELKMYLNNPLRRDFSNLLYTIFEIKRLNELVESLSIKD